MLYQVFPVHQRSHLQKLQKCWVQRVMDRQPIGNFQEYVIKSIFLHTVFISDEISNYFGVQIALYFAWLGHYTTALSIPAIVGLLFWVILCHSH